MRTGTSRPTSTRYRAERQARDTIGAVRRAARRGRLCARRRDQRARGARGQRERRLDRRRRRRAARARRTAAPTGRSSTSRPPRICARSQQVGGAGWVVGDGGVVRKTSDQGVSWIAQNAGTLRRAARCRRCSTPTTPGRSATAASSSRRATAARTGASCRPTRRGCYAVHFIDELQRASRSARAARSSRPATAVRPGAASRAAPPRTCARWRAFGTTLAWAAGQGGTILRSEDGGATWLPCDTPSGATLYAIALPRCRSKAGRPAKAAWCCTPSTAARTGSWKTPARSATLRGLVVLRQRARLGGRRRRRPRCASAAARPTWPTSCCRRSTCRSSRAAATSNGMLCELEARASYAHQPDGGAAERLAPGALPDVPRRVAAPRLGARSAGDPRGRARRPRHRDARAHDRAGARAAAAGVEPVRLELRFDDRRLGCARQRAASACSPRAPSRSSRRRTCARSPRPPATGGSRTSSTASRCTRAARARPSSGRARTARSPMRSSASASMHAQQQTTVRVAARGRDANLDLAVHDRVELIDDDAELIASRRHAASNTSTTATTSSSSCWPACRPARSARIRRATRSCGAGTTSPRSPARTCCRSSKAPGSSSRTACRCASSPGGAYRPGDYWQIPARTITADVEWPRDDDGDPIAREPAGIADAYCRLGIVEVDARRRGHRGQRLPRALPAAHRDGAAALRLRRRPGRGAERAAAATARGARGARHRAGAGRAASASRSRAAAARSAPCGRLAVRDRDRRRWPGRVPLDARARRHGTGALPARAREPARRRWPAVAGPDRRVLRDRDADAAIRFRRRPAGGAGRGPSVSRSKCRVANGADGIAGAVLRATRRTGRRRDHRPGDAHDRSGRARLSFGWQLGAGGPQRVRSRAARRATGR